eukprot:8595545-Karenia_brevis.AAC.1
MRARAATVTALVIVGAIAFAVAPAIATVPAVVTAPVHRRPTHQFGPQNAWQRGRSLRATHHPHRHQLRSSPCPWP